MSIGITHTSRATEELRVELIDVGKRPFATIDLDADGRSYMTFHSPAECDELIKAATEAKRLLLSAGGAS